MDNVALPKVIGIPEAIEARGASLRKPAPYGPDLNPIETLFATLKSLLRKACARTIDGLRSSAGRLPNSRPARANLTSMPPDTAPAAPVFLG